MDVKRTAESKLGGWTTVLPETKDCEVSTYDGGSIIFERHHLSIDNLSGKYCVRATLSLPDVARIIKKLVKDARDKPEFANSLRKSLRGMEADMLYLMLVANGFSPVGRPSTDT